VVTGCQGNKTCTTAVVTSKLTDIATKHHISTLLHKTSTIAMYMQGEGFCQDKHFLFFCI